MLTFKEIEPGVQDLEKVSALAKEAFPPEEYMSPEEILVLKQQDDMSFQAYYDNGQFVGYSLIKRFGKIAYLFFLAVDQVNRGEGYGSQILNLLKQQYSEYSLTIDFEKPDPAAPNSTQRIQRKRFYLQNGFQETGCFQNMRNIDFEIVFNQLPLDFDAFKDMMNSLQIEGLNLKFYTN